MLIDHDDELSEMDQTIVGTVCRIEIPMRSPSALLQVADMLRGLASQCEFTATNKDERSRATRRVTRATSNPCAPPSRSDTSPKSFPPTRCRYQRKPSGSIGAW